jgi:hypothetical protein
MMVLQPAAIPQSSLFLTPTKVDDLNLKKFHTEPKKTILKKRNRIGKTPALKINWTNEEVSFYNF